MVFSTNLHVSSQSHAAFEIEIGRDGLRGDLVRGGVQNGRAAEAEYFQQFVPFVEGFISPSSLPALIKVLLAISLGGAYLTYILTRGLKPRRSQGKQGVFKGSG